SAPGEAVDDLKADSLNAAKTQRTATRHGLRCFSSWFATGAQLCDLRKAFVEHLEKHNPDDNEKGILTGDRGHLNEAGNRLDGQDERLRDVVRDHPGLTAEEYRDRLGFRVAVVTVWRALRRLGLTFKKSPSAPANRIDPTSPPSGKSGGPRSPRRWTRSRRS